MSEESNPYDVVFTDVALKNLSRYPKKNQQLILTRIEKLATDPLIMPNVKQLVQYGVSYRLRVGNYRVLFERDDRIRMIDVMDILPRSQAYRRR